MQENEEIFKAITSSAREAIILIDHFGKITYWNKAAEKIFYYSSVETLDKDLYLLIVPKQYRETYKRDFEEFVKTGQGFFINKTIELNGLRKDRTIVPIELSGSKIILKGKWNAVAIIRDITKRKLVEQKLREAKEELKKLNKELEQKVKQKTKELKEAEEKYHHLFEDSPNSIVLLDMNRMIIDCNSTTERLFGYKKEELINRNFIELEIFEPEFLPLINQRYKFLLRGAIPESMEIKAYKKNGKSIWIKLQGSLVKFKDVNIIQLTIQDINKQKQSDKKLREVWEQYRLLIEHAPLGIFSADKEGNIKIINPPLLKMLGSPSAEATKQINLLTFPLLRKTGISAAIEYCIERGESLSNEFLYRSKWGKEIYARLFLDPIRDPSNQISGVQAIVEDITNWKRVEKELRENEEKYRCLFHHSNDGIIIHNLEGDIIDVNQKVLDQFKYTKSEILMLKIHQLHPIEEIDKAAKLFKEIFKKRLVKFEIRFKKKNSEIFLAEVSTSLFSIGEKEVIQGIIRDISERKQAEQKLIESEEKYRLISENANDLIFIVNMNIITEYINEEVFKKLLGYSKDDVIGKSALNFVHPEDIEKIMKLIRNGLKVGEGLGELRCIDKNNLYHWLELRGKTFIDRDGKTKGLFIARDITERKKAEQKLIESEEKYRHLFENTPVSIMLVDSKRQIVDCNPSTEKLLEYEKKELIGKRFENFSIDLQKFLPILFEPVDTILKVEPSTPVEVQLYKKDNSLIWTQLQSSLIKVGSETLNQVIIQDITHRKKSENLIKEEIIKLKELDQIRKDLITSVSHELKTPLMNIFGGSELLLSMFKENLGK